MWRELIAGLNSGATFANPVSEQALRRAEAALGHEFPPDLKAVLKETDGVLGDYGLGLIWPLERIVADNLALRAREKHRDIYMPFDPLLFFADAGNGDQFAFPVDPARSEVFVWNHEDDSRSWVASNLEDYLRRWLEGTLTI